MGRPKPPAHRIDGQPIYIPEEDEAWDHDRVASEREALPDGQTHLVDDYFDGSGRYRLEPVEGYYDPAKKPERWFLRRPPPDVLLTARTFVNEAIVSEGQKSDNAYAQACLLACRHGIAKVESDTFQLPRRFKALPDQFIAQMDDIVPAQVLPDGTFLSSLVMRLGEAVLKAFRPLDEAEGK